MTNPNFLSIINSTTAAALVTGFTTIFLWILKENKKESESEQDIKAGLRVLLCDRIKFLCNQYILRGYVTIEEYEDLQRMNNVYKLNLKGNGFVKHIMEEVEKLPIKPTEEKRGA